MEFLKCVTPVSFHRNEFRSHSFRIHSSRPFALYVDMKSDREPVMYVAFLMV